MFKVLMMQTNGIKEDLNSNPMDSKSSTLTTQTHNSTINKYVFEIHNFFSENKTND